MQSKMLECGSFKLKLAQAAETAAAAVSVAQTPVHAAVRPGRAAQPLVDTRLMGKLEPSVGLADWKAWRFTVT